MNEGGLLAERQGWHLPGYQTNASDGWTDGSPLEGLNKSGKNRSFDAHCLICPHCLTLL